MTPPARRPAWVTGLRGLAAAGALGAIAALLARGPLLPDTPWRAPLLAGFRIAFGLLLIVRLHRLRAAREALWPASRAWWIDRHLPVARVITAWQVLAALVAVGLGTAAAAAGCLVAGVYVFRRAFTHSLEDVLFQHTAFFLILTGAGEVASVDAALGWTWSPIDPRRGLDLWWLGLALLMFSAGLEKLFSPLWRRGLGFPLFVGLPHLVQDRFRFLRRLPRLGRGLSYVVLGAELLALPAAFHPAARLGVGVVLLGFAVSLFLVVDLSFIGQTLALVLACLLAVDGAALWGSAAPPGSGPDGVTLAIVIAAAAPVVAGCLDVAPGRIGAALTWLGRLTVGLEPIRVFTDTQLHGIFLYRVIAGGLEGTPRSVVPAFRDDGAPGQLQRWHPRVFLKLTYEVTDLCLAVERRGWDGVRSTLAFEAAVALLDVGLGAIPPAERAGVSAVTLEVRAVALAAEGGCVFELGSWQAILAAPVIDGRRGAVSAVARPPPLRRTARRAA